MNIESLSDIWEAVCTECKKSITEIAFNVWLKDLTPVSMSDGIKNWNRHLRALLYQEGIHIWLLLRTMASMRYWEKQETMQQEKRLIK